MSSRLNDMLEETLQARRERGLLRSLAFDSDLSADDLVDFSSNDYLGFARSQQLDDMVEGAMADVRKTNKAISGSSGSRLLTGDTKYAQDLERYLAQFHNADSALVFNSGFDANLSLMACLPQPNSIVLFDELVHNSCREGIRSCRAEASVQFKHNDVSDLERCLSLYKGKDVIIVIESVYSMDGHIAPLKAMLDATQAHGNACMVVDEAHGTGVYGKGGRGLVQELREEHRVFARVHTFGKAVGAHGAVIVGTPTLRSYLVNYARPFIYSTSLPMHSLVTIRCAYQLMEQSADGKQKTLHAIIARFRALAMEKNLHIADSPSPIQAVMISGNERCIEAAKAIRMAGFQVFPIRSPTVPSGEERIRVVLHDFNSMEEVEQLVAVIARIVRQQPPAQKVLKTET